jgi:hypothetical protein
VSDALDDAALDACATLLRRKSVGSQELFHRCAGTYKPRILQGTMRCCFGREGSGDVREPG